ncbi:fungal-specific transcription factor domain-containing protein [Dactylonectria estremocensis]|uniref:Fungal-specific transcription factor domain-containing protein n=1 Tax=Dactylonectria estremocensis TaxID=1079267 RepID=A0A9P9ETE9_9HYPO|nr:fungal-specific transcription factor domain-containing protein [Dactylonectria estremocensis]
MSTEGLTDAEASLKIWSCVICRRRKVRCDRRDPCSNCVRAGIDCHYPVTGRVPRRSRDPSALKSPAQKQSELLSRLRRLEAVVTELSAQVEEPHNGQDSLTSSTSNALSASLPPGSEFDEEFGQLVVGKGGGLHVGNRFWSVFCDEVDNILQAVHDVTSYDESNDSTIPEAEPAGAPGNQGFVFGNRGSPGNLDSLNPLPSQMLFIWQTFVDSVDPFIKVLHIPSINKVIRDLRGNFSSLGPKMEPLLFAISLAAITSMNDDAVTTNFNASKAHLVARYRLGTEQALGQAEFLTTKDIVVVQAFVIYLSVLSYVGASESAWPLTGLLLRVAKSLGLHRDETCNKNQLESELRRRLWWHVCFLDSKTERHGLLDMSITEASFDTELPSAADDIELDSTTSGPIESRTKATNMIPCLMRCEIWRVVHALQANSTSTPEVKLQIFQTAKLRIETNYLVGLRPNIPLEKYVKTMALLFFAKVELVLYRHTISANTESSGTPHIRESMLPTLIASITIINAVHALLTEPTWTNWRWQLAGHVPWHAIGVFLRQACRQSWGPESEQVWTNTKSLLDSASDGSKKDRLWIPLMRLVKNTEAHREAEMTHWATETLGGRTLSGPPVDQWIEENTFGINDGVSFPTNQLSQMVIEHQASQSAYAPPAENSGILSRNGISQSQGDMGGQLTNPQSGLLFQSADPTLWALPVELDSGPSGEIEPPRAIQPDEVDLMDWDAWESTRGVDLVWDLF